MYSVWLLSQRLEITFLWLDTKLLDKPIRMRYLYQASGFVLRIMKRSPVCEPVDLVGAMRKMSPGLSGSAGGGAASLFLLSSVGKSMLFFHMLTSAITKNSRLCFLNKLQVSPCSDSPVTIHYSNTFTHPKPNLKWHSFKHEPCFDTAGERTGLSNKPSARSAPSVLQRIVCWRWTLTPPVSSRRCCWPFGWFCAICFPCPGLNVCL